MASQEEKFLNRAGLRPDESELPYSITTKKVEEYLQKKLDVVIKKMNERAESNPNFKKIDPITINVITTEVGSKFVPFVVIFPMNVLIDKGCKNKGGNDIFNPKREDNSAQMYPEIKKLFDSISYDNKDRDAFKSVNFRRELGIRREAGIQMLMMSKPKISSFNNGRNKVVTLMVDPIRVFYDMLKSADGKDNRNYHVEITEFSRIRTGEYTYKVKRVLNKKNQSYSKSFAEELNHKMQGGGSHRHND